MDEQNSDGQQPGFWESWTASAGQSGEPDYGQASAEPGEDGPAGAGAPADPGQPGNAQPDANQEAAFTQPIGYPQPDYPQPGYSSGGYPAPGYPASGYDQPGHGQPGYAQQAGAQQGQPGYEGQPGQHGGGYGQPGSPGGYGYQPGGGFGPPPGGYGMPGGYGQPPRPRRRGLTTAITYIAVAAMAATAGGLVVAFADSGNQQPAASSGTGNFGNPGNGNGLGGNGLGGNGFGNSGGTNSGASIPQGTVNKVRSAVTPGLVVITSSLKYQASGAAAAATGMIISKSGLVLTNNHVINGTAGLEATVVSTGRRYTANWLGFDKGSDVAVIKLVGASGLTTVPLGDSSSVKLGDNVVGMGNANGVGRISAVPGTITGLNQTITASDDGSGVAPERLTGMLQTNAAIIPGDSGGPLASTDGKVIGMDTAASSNSITNDQQSVGFAIPINRALAIARQIIAGHPGSGVQIGAAGFVGVLVPSGKNDTQSTETNPSAQLRQQEALQQSGFQPNPAPNSCVQNGSEAGVPTEVAPVNSGTLVLGSLCSTPAAVAGLTAGDVITRADDQTVSSPASLMNILKVVPGGSTISLTWVTPSDQTVTRTITLASAPPA